MKNSKILNWISLAIMVNFLVWALLELFRYHFVAYSWITVGLMAVNVIINLKIFLDGKK